MSHELPSVDKLRRSFEDAAVRELQAGASSSRRRRRPRGVALAAVGLLAVGGVATAADLISVGDPEPQRVPRTDRYRPQRQWRVSVVARDTPLPWGVGVYRSKTGEPCAIVGQLRTGVLGVVRDKSFRPFDSSTAGLCGRLGRQAFFVAGRQVAGRTIIYGRARADVATMKLTQPAGTSSAGTGAGGAFVFVFKGSLSVNRISIVGVNRSGSTIR